MDGKQKILVTGASGFLGSMIVDKLVQDSMVEVHAISHSRLGNAKAVCHQVNLLDNAAITQLLEDIRPQNMIHLAWETRHDVYMNSPSNLVWLSAGMHLLKEFQRCGGKRLVSAGTCVEYDTRYQCMMENDTPACEDSLYGISKRSFYNMARQFCFLNGISYVCGRIFFLYGECDKQSRAIPYAITNFLSNKRVSCNASNAYRDYMHVDDGAEAFIALLNSELTGAVNIASGVPTSMGEIFSEIARQMQSDDLLDLKTMNQGMGMIIADNKRMREELGFSPCVSLSEGLARTIRWQKECVR